MLTASSRFLFMCNPSAVGWGIFFYLFFIKCIVYPIMFIRFVDT